MSDYETVKAMRDANWKPAVTYWKEKCDQADATIARLTAERDKWFEASGAHHVASMREAQRADQAEAKLAEVMAERDAARDEGFAQGIEAAAKVASGWLAAFQGVEIQRTSAREYACDAVMDIADGIRALVPPVDAHKTPVHERQAGLSLTDDTQAQPTDNTALVEALEAMLHAVCGETGFVACVRLDSGLAYPWPALDAAEEKAQSVLRALAPQPASSCPPPQNGDETYYSKGKTAEWWVGLTDEQFAWELICAAQDLNDTGLGDDLDKWMPHQVMLADAAKRIKRLFTAAEAWQPTHQHVKRGTEYRHIGTARIQSDVPLDDYSEVEVYIGAEGDLWARRKVEFHDGRFHALAQKGGE